MNSRRWLVIGTAFMAAAAPRPLESQLRQVRLSHVLREVGPDRTVRILTDRSGTVTGTVSAYDASALTIVASSDATEVRLEEVAALWTGDRATGTGAITGALIAGTVGGLILGALVASCFPETCGPNEGGVGPGLQWGIMGGAISGAIGGLFGGIVGAAIPKWTQRYP